jgi:hypothetical protein
MERNLLLKTPVIYGAPVFVRNISQEATGWRRSIRRDGGYWMGSFTISADPIHLGQFFNEYLGYHFEEIAGNKTWEGLIYEMDLTINGITRNRSLDMMYNYVSVKYNDDSDAAQNSAAESNAASISRYGRREELLLLDNYPQTAAEQYRDTYLREHAWPWARVVGVKLQEKGAKRKIEDRLEVSVAGYIFTANWRFETVGDDTDDDVSTWITDIVATDCEYLQTGAIVANTTQVRKETNMPERAWDVIAELTDLGGLDAFSFAVPYRFYVDNDRRAFYEQISTTPLYSIRDGGLYTGPGGNALVSPWKVRPGVVRDLDYPGRKLEIDTWLDDGRDFYVSEVEFGDGFSHPVLKTDYFEESEGLAAQQENIQDMEED